MAIRRPPIMQPFSNPIDERKRSPFNPAYTDPIRNAGRPNTGPPLPGPNGKVIGAYESPNTGPPLPGPNGKVVTGGGMPPPAFSNMLSMQAKMKKGGKINLADCKVNTAQKNTKLPRF